MLLMDRRNTMDKLPREALFNIFLQSSPLTQTFGKPGPMSVAFTVSRVCMSWRKVALSMGVLWSYLDIKLEPKKWFTTMEIFRAWLHRSHSSPLHYSLEFRLEDCKDPGPHLASEFMIRALLPQQHRWENMHLDWVVLASPEFPGIELFRMPILKTLYFTFRVINFDDDEMLEADISLAKSPLLEDIRLWGSFNLDFGGGSIHTLSGISDLMFCGDRSDDSVASQCLDFLKATPNLQLFRTSFKHNGANVMSEMLLDGKERELILPNLRFVILEEGNPAAQVIDRLTLPSLSSLYYDGYDHLGEGDILLRFIERSLPPLTGLWITTYELEEETLITLLQWLPALKDLGLKCMALTRRFFQELTPQETYVSIEDSPEAMTQLLCPLLASIELDQLTFAEDSVAVTRSICDFALARCQRLSTFDAIQFGEHDAHNLPYDFTEEDYGSLSRIAEEEKWVRAEGGDGDWIRML